VVGFQHRPQKRGKWRHHPGVNKQEEEGKCGRREISPRRLPVLDVSGSPLIVLAADHSMNSLELLVALDAGLLQRRLHRRCLRTRRPLCLGSFPRSHLREEQWQGLFEGRKQRKVTWIARGRQRCGYRRKSMCFCLLRLYGHGGGVVPKIVPWM
jgi:hypothetical protein